LALRTGGHEVTAFNIWGNIEKGPQLTST